MADVAALTFDSPDAAPEALREWLVEDKEAGKYVAKVAPASKVVEFRETNIKRGTRISELETKLKDYEGLDPAEARKALAELDKLKQQQAAGAAGTTPEAIQKLVDEQSGRAIKDREAQIEAEKTARVQRETELKQRDEMIAQLVLDSGVTTAAATIPGFYQDETVIRDAKIVVRDMFKVEGGRPVARGSDGTPIFGPDGTTPLTIRDVLLERKHWRAANVNGGGAAGGPHGGMGGAKTMKRSEFEALSPIERAKRAQEGWTLTD